MLGMRRKIKSLCYYFVLEHKKSGNKGTLNTKKHCLRHRMSTVNYIKTGLIGINFFPGC